MKNEEADIIKLMDLLYGEGAAEPEQTEAFLQEHPDLAQELDELREVRSAPGTSNARSSTDAPCSCPSPSPAARIRRLAWPYWAAASAALVLLGFTLAKIQMRFDHGELTIAFGKAIAPPNINTRSPVLGALTAADTQAIQDLVRAELSHHYGKLEQSIALAEANLRKTNDSQRLQLVTQLQSELSALNQKQQMELTALVAASQADNLGKMVVAMQDAHSQQQEKLKWIVQQGFIDWNVKREKDLDRIKDEFNKVYAQVHYQKQEQDKFNRVFINQTNN
ncbi:MAG: hypothetical protein IPO07_18700 [Haliscomenobacter sp.]|nr:hypothetical protein [Haliscomenobacter sp.]MBK9490580.1 hypothetical protein [Haliscomenobacter sp.]